MNCLSLSCYFLLFSDETHLIPPVVIRLVELENPGTLEAVHDVHLPLHIPSVGGSQFLIGSQESGDTSPVLSPGTRHKLGSEHLPSLLLAAFHNSTELTPKNIAVSPV